MKIIMAAHHGAVPQGNERANTQRAAAGLEGLAGDTVQLEREPNWFNDSPPPYESNPVSTEAPSTSQEVSSRAQLMFDRMASRPYDQFESQVKDEMVRLWDYNPETRGTRPIPLNDPIRANATDNIKRCWIEQGIWDDINWNDGVGFSWKHERRLEFELEYEPDPEWEPPVGSPAPHERPLRRKSDIELMEIEARRDESRPYFQFNYQVSRQRGRLRMRAKNVRDLWMTAPDMNTRAYSIVKATWIRHRIWNQKWGILPGMIWQHEEPLPEDEAEYSSPRVILLDVPPTPPPRRPSDFQPEEPECANMG
jgi:hypothetical protein